jgi:hypothetical protein
MGQGRDALSSDTIDAAHRDKVTATGNNNSNRWEWWFLRVILPLFMTVTLGIMSWAFVSIIDLKIFKGEGNRYTSDKGLLDHTRTLVLSKEYADAQFDKLDARLDRLEVRMEEIEFTLERLKQ